MENISIVDILGVGISGFSFLLILFAFKLISNEQKREGNARMPIIATTWFFMGINFLSIIVVGVLGVPALVRNIDLKNMIVTLKEENTVKTAEISVIDAGKKLEETRVGSTDEKKEALRELVIKIDSLQNKPTRQYDSLANFGLELKRQLRKIEKDPKVIDGSFDEILKKKQKIDKMILDQNQRSATQ